MNEPNSPEQPERPQSPDNAAPQLAEVPRDGTAAVAAQAAPIAPATQLPAPQPDDRRSSPRRKKLLRVQIIQVSPNGEGEPFPGWVTDRSLGGLRLEVERAIDVGAALKVHSPFSTAQTPWVEVTVQSVQVMEDCRYLGCAFVRSPTWEVMMQFG